MILYVSIYSLMFPRNVLFTIGKKDDDINDKSLIHKYSRCCHALGTLVELDFSVYDPGFERVQRLHQRPRGDERALCWAKMEIVK